MQRALAIILCLTAIQAGACDRTKLVSSSSRPLAPVAFLRITPSTSMEAILASLGPAARDVGSGLHVLEWDVTDGRIFRVSTAEACGKPYSVGFSAKSP